jgi:hypothetical protein
MIDMGTAGRIKNQFMALVDDDVLHRMDALRIVMGISRAEVNRQVLAGASLAALEHEHEAKLRRLDVVAARAGYRRAEFVTALVSGRVKVPPVGVLGTLTTAELHEMLRDLPAHREADAEAADREAGRLAS